MARNTINYAITDDNRDNGKVFVITEMSAAKAERWATRALLALMGSGAEVPENFENMGMAAMAEVGIRALGSVDIQIVEPLLAEMLECVKFMPDHTKPHVVRDLFIDSDIEEVSTLVKLRAEVWRLHTGFLKAVSR